jgi:hypothetical protein
MAIEHLADLFVTTPVSSALVAHCGPTASVATTAATDRNAPVTSAVSAGAASTTANTGLRAASTWPAANTARVSTRVARPD